MSDSPPRHKGNRDSSEADRAAGDLVLIAIGIVIGACFLVCIGAYLRRRFCPKGFRDKNDPMTASPKGPLPGFEIGSVHTTMTPKYIPRETEMITYSLRT